MQIDIGSKKGFTIIELLIIVSIIGLLAAVILSMGVVSGRDRAAINSYKTTMDSLKTAIELCGDSNRVNGIGIDAGSNVCGLTPNSSKFPEITEKCGVVMKFMVIGNDSDWIMSTDNECKGCKLICNVTGCSEVSGTNCD